MTRAGLDGGFRFENFVVGASNRLAHSAAQAVADAPGTTYNPLFIYGGSGLGKTHLAAAVAYHARHAHPTLRVELTTAEDIVERLHRAVASGQREQFAAPFQQVDLLLIDDVQFLTGQRETQTELLRLFNRMQGSGRQLVMTSDRPPVEIPDVDQRLLSRLSGGLVVDVGAPDFEMRLAILRNASAERVLEVGDGVLEEVARLPFGNVRELKGALNRLVAYQQVEGTVVAPSDVRAVLGDRVSATPVSGTIVPVRTSAPAAPAEYAGFLADVVHEVENRVEKWRVTLGEACAYWRSEGFGTQVLERAIQLPQSPDVNGLLATFSAAVEHLQALEAQATTLDPALRGHPAFRNPELVADAEVLVDRALASALPLAGPNPALSRNAFDVGLANQLAVKAADAVMQQPGKRYNPLFIHGPSGTGKTHLAHAIANGLRDTQPRAVMACLSSTLFVDELIAAMQEGGVERWRARYRAAEVFVLDDVQQLADKERTQDELFHLFNVLYERGAQIVIASDRPPRELRGLADRIRSRFEGGLVVSLQPPDRALRERLAYRWLTDEGQSPDQALIAYLGDREVANMRELQGIVTRLAAASELLAVPLDVPLARRELEGRAPRVASAPLTTPRGSRDGVDDFFLDREKVLWEWPDLGARVIEELR